MDDVPPPQDPNPTMDSKPDGLPPSTDAPPATSAASDSMMDQTNEEGETRSSGGGNLYLRPVFFGNLSHGCLASDVENIFTNPSPTGGSMGDGEVKGPYPVDRVDMKRGYCFVFLKDPDTLADKDRTEQYVAEINGMNIAQVSNALRAEFARGDGRVKKKEDERRKKILPNETLFVVNFHEETTKREDLQMLFEPFGELVRIDMKRNYAFVQFKTVEESIRAKEATNGGKLDQSEITVEFVARRMGEGGERRGGGRRYDDRGDRGGRGGGGGYRGGRDDYRPRRDDYRPRRYDDRPRRDYDDRRRSRSRSRSPGYRRRSRSRSPGYDRDYRRDRGADRGADRGTDRGADRGADRGTDRGTDHRSSRDEYRPSSRGGRDSYEDRERTERGYGRP